MEHLSYMVGHDRCTIYSTSKQGVRHTADIIDCPAGTEQSDLLDEVRALGTDDAALLEATLTMARAHSYQLAAQSDLGPHHNAFMWALNACQESQLKRMVQRAETDQVLLTWVEEAGRVYIWLQVGNTGIARALTKQQAESKALYRSCMYPASMDNALAVANTASIMLKKKHHVRELIACMTRKMDLVRPLTVIRNEMAPIPA